MSLEDDLLGQAQGLHGLCGRRASGPCRASHRSGSAIPKDLQAVAAAFVDLQEARHEADYNVAERFTKSEAAELINEVEGAFEAWRRVRQKKITRLFLTGCCCGSAGSGK